MTAQRALPQISHQRSSSERHRPPARGGVGVEQLLARAATQRRQRAAEAPRPHAHPAEVLGAVAGVDELPVDQRRPAVLGDDQVGEPEVAVHDRGRRRRGRVEAQPAQAELDRGMRLADPVEVALEHHDGGLGRRQPREVRARAVARELGLVREEAGRLDRVQPRGGLRDPRDQHGARARPALVAAAAAAAAPRRPPARRRCRTASARPGSRRGRRAARASSSTCHSRSLHDVARTARRVAAEHQRPPVRPPGTTSRTSRRRPGAARSRSARRRAPPPARRSRVRVAGHAARRVHAQARRPSRSAPSPAAAAGCRRRARPSPRAGR